MVKNVDKRNFEYRAPISDTLRDTASPFTSAFKTAAIDGVFGDPAGGTPISNPVSFDSFTGSVERIEIAIGAGDVSLQRHALDVVKAVTRSSPLAGFAEDTMGRNASYAEYALPLSVAATSQDTQTVHLTQYHRGIPLFLITRTVHVRPDRTVITGNSVDGFSGAETDLKLSAKEAVYIAAEYVAQGDGEPVETAWGETTIPSLSLEGFSTQKLSVFDLPTQPTVFDGAPFEGPINAYLTYFYQGPAIRLAWAISLTFPDGVADYLVLIAAGEQEPGEVLYAQDRVCRLIGRCNLHAHNPDQGGLKPTLMPLMSADFPAPMRPVMPREDWVESAHTEGNNVKAILENGQPLTGHQLGNHVDFNPADVIESATAHTFHFCNVMHNFFEALGFDENSGNFQHRHNSSLSGGGDSVNAFVYKQNFSGVASMLTPPEGLSPTMKMGLYAPTGNHSGMDSDVVFHEFVHGVTNRLVGGPSNALALREVQSGGMGEGWSDYFALTYQNALSGADKNVSGDYLTGNPGGIRSAPYDDAYPKTYGDVKFMSSVHGIGEIWCATLMMMTRKARAALPEPMKAYAICWQIVVDGLKLSPANPSFLDARNAVLDALGDLISAGAISTIEHSALRRAAWESFAHFGMGTLASSQGAHVQGIVADYTLPNDL